MDKDNQDKFDLFIKQSLENGEVDPPIAAWNNIQTAVYPKNNSRKFPFLGWLLALLFLVVTPFIAYQFIDKPSLEKNSKVLEVQSPNQSQNPNNKNTQNASQSKSSVFDATATNNAINNAHNGDINSNVQTNVNLPSNRTANLSNQSGKNQIVKSNTSAQNSNDLNAIDIIDKNAQPKEKNVTKVAAATSVADVTENKLSDKKNITSITNSSTNENNITAFAASSKNAANKNHIAKTKKIENAHNDNPSSPVSNTIDDNDARVTTSQSFTNLFNLQSVAHKIPYQQKNKDVKKASSYNYKRQPRLEEATSVPREVPIINNAQSEKVQDNKDEKLVDSSVVRKNKKPVTLQIGGGTSTFNQAIFSQKLNAGDLSRHISENAGSEYFIQVEKEMHKNIRPYMGLSYATSSSSYTSQLLVTPQDFLNYGNYKILIPVQNIIDASCDRYFIIDNMRLSYQIKNILLDAGLTSNIWTSKKMSLKTQYGINTNMYSQIKVLENNLISGIQNQNETLSFLRARLGLQINYNITTKVQVGFMPKASTQLLKSSSSTFAKQRLELMLPISVGYRF